MKNVEEFVEFLNQSHTSFNAIENVEKQLREYGFIKLKENASWKLENNRYYYVVRNQTSLIAFKVPEISDVKSLNIVASHSDSPCFKIKPVSEMNNDKYSKLNVEAYGSAILSTWFDKPLSIAGRVIYKNQDKLVSKLIDFDKDIAIIPNVAIHQNKDINNGYKYNIQNDLIPLVGLGKKEKFILNNICDELKIDESAVLSYDLYLYNREKARVWGTEDEFISSGRIDNLESVFVSLKAFLKSYSKNSLNVLAIFDNEEVGSITKQGMASSFLSDVIDRVFASFYYVGSDVKAILANSMLVSADNAHAVHPNHPELYDNTNQSIMNGGVVIKTAASQSYVSDGVTFAITKTLCEHANVPYQIFANRSDNRGGSTQAAISTINLPIMAVDVGCAQLAMHSSYETAGSKDVDYMIDFMSEFYNSSIIIEDDNILIVK